MREKAPALSALHPLHHSLAGRARLPADMERLTCPREMSEMLERVSLSIFADMTNAGQPFQKALAAIYLSGLQHGVAGQRDRRDIIKITAQT